MGAWISVPCREGARGPYLQTVSAMLRAVHVRPLAMWRAGARGLFGVAVLAVGAGALVLAVSGLPQSMSQPLGTGPSGEAALVALVGAAATVAGAAPVLALSRLSRRGEAALVAFAAGAMLAAAVFSLLVPLLSALAREDAPAGGLGATVAGVVTGMAAMAALERAFAGLRPPGTSAATLGHPRGLLLATAIALHNLPEGFAVGAAVAHRLENAQAVAVAIALQDLPEGLVVAVALRALGLARAVAFLLASASGLVEPVAAALAPLLLSARTASETLAIGAAAGAMVFVALTELGERLGRQPSVALLPAFALGFAATLLFYAEAG